MSKKDESKKLQYTYTGKLESYCETGYEGHHVALLQDNRGIDEKGMYDLKWASNIRSGDYLKVFKKDGSVEWEGFVTKDRRGPGPYPIDFVPKEVDVDKWFRWLAEEREAVLTTKHKLD